MMRSVKKEEVGDTEFSSTSSGPVAFPGENERVIAEGGAGRDRTAHCCGHHQGQPLTDSFISAASSRNHAVLTRRPSPGRVRTTCAD